MDEKTCCHAHDPGNGGRPARALKDPQPGQREDGSLVFSVRVRGIGAKPYSPKELAYRLCQRWSEVVRMMETNPLAEVEINDTAGE